MTAAAEKICGAMLSMLQRSSFDEISVKELINEAGVSRSSYNYNFYSLEHVIQTIIDSFGEGLGHVIENAFTEGHSLEKGKIYELIFEYIYSKRGTLRILTSAGFMDLVKTSMTDALRNFFALWRYNVFDAAAGSERILDEGMIYSLKNMENAYRIVADFAFWAEMDYNLPVSYMVGLVNESRDLRIQVPEKKNK